MKRDHAIPMISGTETTPLPELISLDSAAIWLSAVTGTTWNSNVVLDRCMGVAFAVAPERALDHAKYNAEASKPEESGVRLSGPPMMPDGLFQLTFIQAQCLRTRGYVTIEYVDFRGRQFDLCLKHRFRISTDDVRIHDRDLKLLATRLDHAQPSDTKPSKSRRGTDAFHTAFGNLLNEIEVAARKYHTDMDRWSLRGTKNDLYKFISENRTNFPMPAEASFITYIRGTCNFKQHEKPIYDSLFQKSNKK
jgi:hypothetical protein